MKPVKPPAQQSPKPEQRKIAPQEKPWRFCWYDIFRGPYIENTGGKQPVDLTPYEFPTADKVNPVGDAKYDVPKPKP